HTGDGSGRATRELGLVDAFLALLRNAGSKGLTGLERLRQRLESTFRIRDYVDLDFPATLDAHVKRAEQAQRGWLGAGERAALKGSECLPGPGELELLDIEAGADPERISVGVKSRAKHEQDTVAVRSGQDVDVPTLGGIGRI